MRVHLAVVLVAWLLVSCGGDDDGSSGGGGAGSGATMTCGNGVREGTEVCDGDDLGMTTCADLNKGIGILACNPVTCQFDVTMCGSSPPASTAGASG